MKIKASTKLSTVKQHLNSLSPVEYSSLSRNVFKRADGMWYCMDPMDSVYGPFLSDLEAYQNLKKELAILC